MASFVVYSKLSADELRQIAEETIPQIEGWFAANPDRQDCNVEAWYGKHLTVQRGKVAEQVNALLEETLKTN